MISLALLIAQGIFLILLYVFLLSVVRIVLADLRRQIIPRRLGRVAPGRGQLVVLQGDQPARGEEFMLQSSVITMGRDPSNELVISDRFASGQHARIAVANGGYWIEDLGSKNGTFVNGERIAGATPLNPGDRIEVGDTLFRFEGVP